MGSTWGHILKFSIFGESHGEGIGVVIDGFPSGISYDTSFILSEMERRAPGRNMQSTQRKETDLPEVLSGIYQGYTTGAPICAVIKNQNTRSSDYALFLDQPRPSHADYTGSVRYGGYQDPRGGGHFSGRLTAPLVFAGALCKLYLKSVGVSVGAHLYAIGSCYDDSFDMVHLHANTLERLRMQEYPILNLATQQDMLKIIEHARKAGDSVGGVIECGAVGLPAGIGSPMFRTVEGTIVSLLYGIPAVKGVEFGDGFHLASLYGSQANDAFCYEDAKIKCTSNHNGGVLGGITNSMPLIVRTCIKPTPSIFCAQETLSIAEKKQKTLQIHGRHDPCIAIRAVPVVESAVAIALTDLLLEANGYAKS